jgi:hypothetical protein
MPLFRKKADPISIRSKELTSQISALEEEIRRLSTNLDSPQRNSASPKRHLSAPAGNVAPRPDPLREVHFESVQAKKGSAAIEADPSAAHFNDLGVRKYDLVGAMRRARSLFSPVAAENPKLVTYLAAGSVKGLRPLRYEKRIARNRFIFLSLIFVVILWGIAAAFLEYR